MLSRSIYYLVKNYSNQSLRESELRDLQSRLFTQLVTYCFSQNDFYSRKWSEENLSAEDFRSIEDLEKLPTVGTKEVRSQMQGMEAVEDTDITANSMISAGSESGDRNQVLFDSQSHDWMTAVLFRGLVKRGYRPFMSQIYYQKKQFRRGVIEDKIFPHERVEPSLSFAEQIEQLQGSNGGFLFYFSNVLFTLAKKINQSDMEFEGYFDGIVCHGEILTEQMQTYISDVFNSPVYGHFGASEAHSIGWKCPEGGYHINSDSIIVELLDGGSKPVSEGCVGEVALSSLVKTKTPMIRYLIGDLGVEISENCSCDSGFQRIEFKGKKSNTLRGRDQEAIYPKDFIEVLSRYEELLAYRLVDGGRKLRYIPNEEFDEEILDSLREELSDLGIEASFEEVENLDITPGGKLPPIDI